MIVNTADKASWYSGQISSAILTKAGPKMEQELESTNVANKNIIITKPYNLHCTEVYHTLCTERSSDNADQVVWLCV